MKVESLRGIQLTFGRLAGNMSLEVKYDTPGVLFEGALDRSRLCSQFRSMTRISSTSELYF